MIQKNIFNCSNINVNTEYNTQYLSTKQTSL